jgi:cellulose synthase/poly-beta-1,6-N-acetylglucosamine synthase-like glycosyltransferase
MKVDFIQIIIACGIFSIFLFAMVITFSITSLIPIIFASGLVIYQIVSKGSPELEFKYGNKRMSLYAISLMVLPFVIATAIAYDGYVSWLSIPKAIFIWSISLSFWYSLLFVPLAIRSGYKESMMKEPDYYPIMSIIIPAYNEEKVIGLTIEALIHAEYPDKEIIIVDDGSIDNTLEIAKRYKHQAKVLHKENGGKASALNYGLTFAKGEIIVIVDADTVVGKKSLKMLARGFQKKEVAAVAGNIKIRNTVNLLTKCQALEYLTGIQIMRRGLDYFGSIPIVPGALGAFRRESLKEAGDYQKATLVEDFDATITVLKSGLSVQGSNSAVGYTQAPQKLNDFFKQRKRWYRGNLQVMKRHSNVLTNPRFGFLHKFTFPLMLINMLVIPFTGLAVWVFAAISVIQGEWQFVLFYTTMYIILQYLFSALAIRIDGDEKKNIVYSIFMLIGYKQLVDFLAIKAVIEEALKRKSVWTSAERVRS